MKQLFFLPMLIVFYTAISHAQQSLSFQLSARVFDSGGSVSSSPTYNSHSIIGQAVQSSQSASNSYALSSGAECAFCGYVVSTAVELPIIPGVMRLYQNYPNPFNPTTTIVYELERPTEIEISLYSLLGSRLRILERGFREAGLYNLEVEALQLESGVYFYRMTSKFGTLARKMVVMR